MTSIPSHSAAGSRKISVSDDDQPESVESERMPRSSRPSITASVLVGVVAVLVMGGGFWSLSHGSTDHFHGDYVEIGESIELPDGLIRVDAVRPEIMAAMLMPASLMPDPVPDGYRRFTVDLSVLATAENGLDYSTDMFTISGEGLDPTPVHRAVTQPGFVPAGSQATLSVLFDSPLGVEPLFLDIEGADRQVLLDGDLGSGHNHGEAPADIVVTGFFEAEIEDFAFLPEDLIVEVGTQVRFHNHDGVVHDVTAVDESWTTGDLGEDINSDVITFDQTGTINYFCSIHPSMTGTINVVSSS